MTRPLRPMVPSDQADLHLLSSEPLRIALEDDPTIRRMWPLVLGELAGRPAWPDVARRAISNHEFSIAAKLTMLIDGEQRREAGDAVVEAWKRTREELERELARMADEAAAWVQNGFNAGEVNSLLAEARAEAGKLPPRDSQNPLADLTAFKRETLTLTNGWLEEARGELSKLQIQKDRRRQEIRRAARDLKQDIDSRVGDLMEQLDASLKVVLKRAAPLVLSAFERHDISALESLKEGIERLAAEDAEPLSILIAQDSASADAPTVAPGLPSRPISVPPPSGVAPAEEASPVAVTTEPQEPQTGTAPGTPAPAQIGAPTTTTLPLGPSRRLSSLAEARLGRHKGVPADGAEPAALLLDVIDRWHTGELVKHTAQAAGIAVRRDSGWEIAQCAALLGEAKALIVEGDAAQAQALFAEALGAGFAAPRLPDADRFRDTAAWGILVTLMLPHLSSEERKTTLDTVNLSMLFYRRIGDLPLRQVDDLNLLGALGAVLAAMDATSAEYFFREYLKPYLKDRPIAASEVALGLFSTPQINPAATLVVLSMLLRDVEGLAPAASRVDAVLQEVGSLQSLRPEDRWWEAAERLRRKLAGLSSENEVLNQLEQAIALLQQKQRGKGAKGPRLHTRLLTPEPQSDAKPYVVLEVLNLSPIQPLRHLRVDAAIVDPVERVELRATIEESLATVAPEQHAEVVVHVPKPATWPENPRLRVRFSTATLQGTRTYEQSVNESFALRLRPSDSGRGRKPDNPYAVGGAVLDPSGIVGRKEETERIIRSLIGEKRDNVVVVLGERRMGKTTVLNAVEQEPEVRERYGPRVVRIDVQDVPFGERAGDFFVDRIVEPTVRKLASVGVRAPIVREEFFAKSPYEAFKQFMVDLDGSLTKTRVLIVIDELEKLLTVVDQQREPSPQSLGSEVMASLRAVMMQTKNLSFILAGVTDVLRKHTTQHANRLFRLGIEIELKALPREAAEELIEQPCKVAYEVLPNARDIIVGLTGRQPYLVQYVCHHLFEHMVRVGATVATRTDVELVVRRDILSSARLFQHFVEAVPDPIDAEIIQALGALQRGNETVPVTAIARHLARGGTTLSEDDISRRLLWLRERTPAVVDDMIRFTRRFRLTVGLYAQRLRLLQRDPHGLVVRAV